MLSHVATQAPPLNYASLFVISGEQPAVLCPGVCMHAVLPENALPSHTSPYPSQYISLRLSLSVGYLLGL